MPNISLSSFKRYLESLSPEDLNHELQEPFRMFAPVKEYYQVKLAEGGQEAVIEKYKKIIAKEFYAPSGQIRPGPGRLSVARKAVMDFKKLSDNKLDTLGMMLFYVEQGVNYADTYAIEYERFYDSMEKMYETACKYAQDNLLADNTKVRFKAIVENTSGFGWGFHDMLSDIFYRYFPPTKVINQ